MNYIKKLTSLIVLTLVASVANAQNPSVINLEIDELKQGRHYNDSVEFFWGLGLGYMDQNETLETEGLPFNGKFIASFFPAEKWLIDTGAGLVSQTFTGQAEKDTVLSGIIDLSGRYRFANDWQLGPQLKSYIGNGDSFASSSETFTTFVGAQVMKEAYIFEKFRSRMGLSLTTDIGIPNQTAFVTSFEMQFALGNDSPTRHASNREPIESFDIDVEEETPAIETQNTEKSLFFQLNQRSLSRIAENDLMKSVRLDQNVQDKKYQYVEVVGYADSTGGDALNLMVSKARATAVRNELIQQGVPTEKIRIRWVGEAHATAQGQEEPLLRKVDVRFVY